MSWIKDLLKPETRSWKEFYRNRWQPDRIVRSTHCVSCTGGCSSRSDWEIFRSLAEQVSQLAERHLPNPIKDQITNPLARDPADDIAQPSIKDWAKGECEPLPGKTMPHLKVVERNYKNLYNQFILLGPLAHNGMGAHGVKYELADLLEYPGADWPPRLKQLSESLGDEALAEFSRQTKSLPLASLQETYTQTFDLNPVASLEIGYHLFGESYKRGLFLAQLRETEAQCDLDEPRQLPDYLPTLLRLLTRLGDCELREDLIAECLLPAIGKMKTALQSKENPYAPLLATVEARLQAEAPARRTGVLGRELNVLARAAELNFIG
jgi:nitrate reductase molybdenum cofactor assembly chaperone